MPPAPHEAPAAPDEVELRAGAYRASSTSHGGALASLRHEERDLILPSGGALGRPAYEGAICAPWPNRVVDGRWRHRSVPQDLVITEPQRGHALHGFVHDQPWTLLTAREDAVRWGLDTEPQPGYPWALSLESAYRLDAALGLTWDVTARLRPHPGAADGPAPYGVAVHPYLVAGEGPAQRWTLELPAETVLLTDDRLTPRELVPVAEAGLDLRRGPALGSQPLDHAFGDLSGSAARLRTSDGTGVEVSWPERHRWVQVFTAQWDPLRPRDAVAIEPMTCPPDAFNSGTDLIWLGEEPVTLSWQIAAI